MGYGGYLTVDVFAMYRNLLRRQYHWPIHVYSDITVV